ncbi:hypothetical protein ACLMJK_000027 [Lecanora helva]
MYSPPTWSSILKSPRILSTAIALVCLLAVFLLSHLQPSSRISYFTSIANNTSKSPSFLFRPNSARLKDVHNSTLGFEKVFVVNLPSRPDKLDAFALISSLTGFKVDVIDGVLGQEVLNKSLPALEGIPEDTSARNNIVGCWRAHLNFARTIVENDLSSALVMEDDADWNTGLKDQLDLFAQGSQFVTGVEPGQKLHSPYGDDWDLIWLGHCGNQIRSGDDRRFVIENDATVPAVARRANFAHIPNMTREGYDNHTRIVYRAKRGLCLYGYALSYRGARKLLRYQATRQEFKPIDISMGDWCEDNHDIKCIGVYPQLIDSHKGPGRKSRDSDIGNYDPNDVRTQGFTFNIVHSTRLNVDHLLADEWDKIERQWLADPEVTGPPRAKAMSKVLKFD